MEQVRIKREREGATLPERKTEGAAGYDLCVPETVLVKPGRNVVPMGFSLEMPRGWFATVKARSGFSSRGFHNDGDDMCFNADVLTGTVDSDYRGEVGVIVKNCGGFAFCIKKGTRIAQLIFQRHESPELLEVESLGATVRGGGGFGSTGEV